MEINTIEVPIKVKVITARCQRCGKEFKKKFTRRETMLCKPCYQYEWLRGKRQQAKFAKAS